MNSATSFGRRAGQSFETPDGRRRPRPVALWLGALLLGALCACGGAAGVGQRGGDAASAGGGDDGGTAIAGTGGAVAATGGNGATGGGGPVTAAGGADGGGRGGPGGSGGAAGGPVTGGSGGTGGGPVTGGSGGAGGAGGCTPNALFCQGQQLRRCTADGLNSTLDSQCSTSQYCDRTTPSCRVLVCTPGQPGCDGSVATTCNGDGSGFTGTRIDCAPMGLVCSKGSCLTAVCAPGAKVCDGTTIRQCSADGQSSSLSFSCATGFYCEPATMSCKPQICTPAQPICLGAVAGTCSAAGGGIDGAGTDCTARGQLCSQGGCTSDVVDVVGDPSPGGSTVSSVWIANFYTVESSRTLTRIEQYFGTTTVPSAVTFTVFESSAQIGTYTQIATANLTSFGGGYVNTTLNPKIPLVAGRFYAIGVQWGGGVLVSDLTANPGAPRVSFGAVFYGTQKTDGSSIPRTLVVTSVPVPGIYYPLDVQRLHTAP